ncbi:glycerol-3-phosphate acyltransferase domain protein [Mycobacterium xenopi 3993]|nr:glycerol-3-phosphate acyltransferase domain protein [Mycobacterium xenopi 3993]
MTTSAADTGTFSTTDDTLVLASVSSSVEAELLNDWLDRQRQRHPETKIDVLRLPPRNAPPGALAQLVEQLEADEDRSIVPVRVFWLPPPRVARWVGWLGCCPVGIRTIPVNASNGVSCAAIPAARG